MRGAIAFFIKAIAVVKMPVGPGQFCLDILHAENAPRQQKYVLVHEGMPFPIDLVLFLNRDILQAPDNE